MSEFDKTIDIDTPEKVKEEKKKWAVEEEYDMMRYVTYPEKDNPREKIEKEKWRIYQQKRNQIRWQDKLMINGELKRTEEMNWRRIFVPYNLIHSYYSEDGVVPYTLALYCLFMIKCGMDELYVFNEKDVMGKLFHVGLNRYREKIAYRMFLLAMRKLQNSGYIEYETDKNGKKGTTYYVRIHKDKMLKDCKNQSRNNAHVYFDEFQKIMREPNGVYALAVLLILRFKMYYRNPNVETDTRSETCYYDYATIAKRMRSTRHYAKTALETLEELNLIRYLPCISGTYLGGNNEIKRFVLKGIFCNYERRFRGEVLESGDEYCIREIEKAMRQSNTELLYKGLAKEYGYDWRKIIVDSKESFGGNIVFNRENYALAKLANYKD